MELAVSRWVWSWSSVGVCGAGCQKVCVEPVVSRCVWSWVSVGLCEAVYQ